MRILDEKGIGILQVLLFSAFIAGIAMVFASRTTSFQKNMANQKVKESIVTDRNIVKFDLMNRPFPPAE
jgi:hypothetical protein